MPVTTVSVLKQRRVKIKAPGGGKQAQNLFVSKLSKAAEMIAGVNRNLAQDIQQVRDQTGGTDAEAKDKGRYRARRSAFACSQPDEACSNVLFALSTL